MKMTLLAMVQNILSALDADEINSISDIPEGQQVAEIIQEVYFQMLTWATTPELHNAYFNLQGLSDTTKPNYLQLPDNVTEVFWWKYDGQESGDTTADYQNIDFCSTEDFFERVMSRDATDTNILTVTTTDGVPLYIENDKAPEFYTILEDSFIVTDSYDSAVDTTLQGSKTVAAGRVEPTFSITDSFIPDIDANLFPFLLAESKAVAFSTINQITNNKIERISREQKIRHQAERYRFKKLNTRTPDTEGANFGRPRITRSLDSKFPTKRS